jgi:alpha-glucosidase (family GH31 glycosyl hydrolase)
VRSYDPPVLPHPPSLLLVSWDIHKEATQLGLYIKNKDGNDFDGWCWPGQSSYLDFTDAKVRQWWAEKFALDKYVGSTLDLFTWNDMNVRILSPHHTPLLSASL